MTSVFGTTIEFVIFYSNAAALSDPFATGTRSRHFGTVSFNAISKVVVSSGFGGTLRWHDGRRGAPCATKRYFLSRT
jgi:hypothetical protein